ncbi:MAG: hypothetical protein EA352_02085 [Gemmatimonadales bacterium]|nr:MAG: hypothetical protein EA352_02085 [Gemmatimonadales bacterium]
MPRSSPTRRLSGCLACLLALLVWGPGVSSLEAQQVQGDVELQLTASLLSTVGTDRASFASAIVQAKGGYFVTERVQVGAFPSLLYGRTEVEVGGQWIRESDTRLGMGLFANYSFLAEDAMTVPYVGGQFYRIDLTDSDETGWLGVSGGVKVYLSRSLALDMGGNYLVGLGDGGGALVLFQTGLGVLF